MSSITGLFVDWTLHFSTFCVFSVRFTGVCTPLVYIVGTRARPPLTLCRFGSKWSPLW